MAKQPVVEVAPEVNDQIAYGFVQTLSGNVENTMTNAKLGALALLGAEIDSALYAYNQICSNMYMSNYFRSNYGENPTITIPNNYSLHSDVLATYGELWKINFQLTAAWGKFYELLDDSTTVRVYNNEPIMITTPSRNGYVVVHPSVHSSIVTGTDEYGAYYEANIGGIEDTTIVIHGQHVQSRRITRRRGRNVLPSLL